MARRGELQLPKTQRLSLISMSSSAVEKAAVLECLRRLSMTDVLVLDLEMMPQSHGLEFMSDIAVPTVDPSDLVESTVAYADFKRVMYECFQASLDVAIGGCKVIIRSSGTGLFADVVSRFEQAYLNMIELDGMDGDGKRAVLHAEQFSLHGRIPSDLNRILHDAVRWQNMPATVHDPPIATNFSDEALDIDEGTSCTLLGLKNVLVDRAVADVVPRISEPTQLGLRMKSRTSMPQIGSSLAIVMLCSGYSSKHHRPSHHPHHRRPSHQHHRPSHHPNHRTRWNRPSHQTHHHRMR